jgi:hypothetical protein
LACIAACQAAGVRSSGGVRRAAPADRAGPFDFVHRAGGLASVRQVGAVHSDPLAGAGELRQQRLPGGGQVVDAARDQADARALGQQAPGAGQPDALAAAGNEGVPALELQIHA